MIIWCDLGICKTKLEFFLSVFGFFRKIISFGNILFCNSQWTFLYFSDVLFFKIQSGFSLRDNAFAFVRDAIMVKIIPNGALLFSPNFRHDAIV